MLLNINLLLLACALIVTVLHSMSKAPLWPAVLLIIVAMLVSAGLH